MKATVAGTRAKSDCEVSYLPGEDGLEIRVRSSVATLFGHAVEEAARHEAEAFDAKGLLSIEDDGALDHVVAARVEAALRAACLLRRPAGSGGTEPRPAAPSQYRRDRPRRSRLYLPGNQSELPINVGLFGADCVLLDLEDSVAQDRKAEARILVRRLLEGQRGCFGASEVVVRLNSLDSPCAMEDLAEITPAAPEALVLPKCESAADIEKWDQEVGRVEKEAGLEVGRILFMPLVETARGVAAASQIAAASKRNVALCFGAEDFRADLGVEKSPGEEEIAVARGLIVIAARAAGIEALDSVYSDTDDLAGLEASARRARALGFSGKGLVHPSQIEIVHRVFSPSEAEVARARRVVEALARAEAAGQGVASLDGAMVDAPVATRARRMLAMAGEAAKVDAWLDRGVEERDER